MAVLMLSVFHSLWMTCTCFEIDSLGAFHVERSLVDEDPAALSRVRKGSVRCYTCLQHFIIVKYFQAFVYRSSMKRAWKHFLIKTLRNTSIYIYFFSCFI